MTNVLQLFKSTCSFSDEVKERKSTPLRLLFGFLLAFLVLVFIYLSYTLIKPLNQHFNTPNGMVAKAYVAILFSLLLISYIILRINRKTNLEVDLFYIVLASLLIKLVYMLYTNGHTRQYDTWSSNHNGHYDYALYIYDHFSLPNHTFTEANIYQFYHPPLYYYVAAIWMKIYSAIGFNKSLVTDTDALFCSTQILITFFTYLISYYAVKTLRLVCKTKAGLYIGAVFVCFYPRLFQFSGQINNDVLACLFVICSVFRLFKYIFDKKSYKNICLSALYLGLAMCTKLSAVIVCLGYAAYFLFLLVRSIKKKEGEPSLKTVLIHYGLFLVIVAPIGLWFQLYAHNVYGIPFNFVFRNLNPDLFTGTRNYVLARSYLNVNSYDMHNEGLIYTNPFVNVLARYVSPFLVSDYAERGVFAYAFGNYNILTYALKSTLFGEFSYWGGEGFGIVALLGAYIMWFTAIALTIINIIKKRYDVSMIVSLGITLSVIVFYLYLQISMPYGCSMDARYIVPILLPLGVLIVKNFEFMPHDNKLNKTLRYVLLFSTLTFAIGGGLFYCFAI